MGAATGEGRERVCVRLYVCCPVGTEAVPLRLFSKRVVTPPSNGTIRRRDALRGSVVAAAPEPRFPATSTPPPLTATPRPVPGIREPAPPKIG